MEQRTETTALKLLALVWLYRDWARPRTWYCWRTRFGMRHVTVYTDRHRRRDLNVATVTGSKSAGWVMRIDMPDWGGSELAETTTFKDLGKCGNARVAEALAVRHLTDRLTTLETALLAEAGMSPDAVRVLDAICHNDAQLKGPELIRAAAVAKVAAS